VTTDPISTPGLTGGADQSTATTAPARDPRVEQVKKLALEFEAMLMTQMLREMRRSMLSPDDEIDGGLGRDTMTDTIDVELGRALSRVGGFGMSKIILEAFDRNAGVGLPTSFEQIRSSHEPVASNQADVAQAALAPPVRSATLEALVHGLAPVDAATGASGLMVPGGQVTSAYGWRRDPFSGALRFHQGIDVARAYGQDVAAAGAGQVVFAGDRGTYGTMVVLEHPSGQRTLYAHLLAAEVKTGDQVGAGQVIGRAGDSGRSTGPHLHFEVIEAGHTVDPASNH